MSDASWFARVPKVELHVHLEGAIPHDTLFELIEKYGGDPDVPDVAALARRFAFRDFGHFIEMWSWKNRFLREYEDFTHIARGVARSFADQRIRYAEMFFSPSLFVRKGLEPCRLAEAVRAGLARVPGVRVALVADLVRDYGPERELPVLHALADARALGVVGIGIGGSEHEFPPEPFAALYEQARWLGFRTTAHAGEAAGAESVRGALQVLAAERIGHATRAWEDDALLDALVARRVPLEMCPVSNLRTGVVRSLAQHPIRRCFERGALVTVNSDDPAMFGTSVADELRALEEHLGFSRDEIRRVVLNGIEASWLDDGAKQRMRGEFESDAAFAEA